MAPEKPLVTPLQRVRARGEDIRRFIVENVESHPRDINKVTARHFGISRQAVHKQLQKLSGDGVLSDTGETRNHLYLLTPTTNWTRSYDLAAALEEDVVWSQDVRPSLEDLAANVIGIWHHGFTEMFNNAIDHSSGTGIRVNFTRNAISSEITVTDDGVGIFRKIQLALGLADERQAILELAKGKLTTDPKKHSGEGIFFTSRMFTSFRILSGGAYFSHEHGSEDWLLENEPLTKGTTVFMNLRNNSTSTTKEIFDAYVSGDDYDFSKTVIPVKLAQYGNDKLISRSQAKRILARVELFKTVVLDFREVDSIGQAFADELFRVFANQHPEIILTPIHTKPAVKRMIERARSGGWTARV